MLCLWSRRGVRGNSDAKPAMKQEAPNFTEGRSHLALLKKSDTKKTSSACRAICSFFFKNERLASDAGFDLFGNLEPLSFKLFENAGCFTAPARDVGHGFSRRLFVPCGVSKLCV